jgi:hypothetical protein
MILFQRSCSTFSPRNQHPRQADIRRRVLPTTHIAKSVTMTQCFNPHLQHAMLTCLPGFAPCSCSSLHCTKRLQAVPPPPDSSVFQHNIQKEEVIEPEAMARLSTNDNSQFSLCPVIENCLQTTVNIRHQIKSKAARYLSSLWPDHLEKDLISSIHFHMSPCFADYNGLDCLTWEVRHRTQYQQLQIVDSCATITVLSAIHVLEYTAVAEARCFHGPKLYGKVPDHGSVGDPQPRSRCDTVTTTSHKTLARKLLGFGRMVCTSHDILHLDRYR